MSEPVAFLELEFGKIDQLDVHGLTKEEAKAEIIHKINSLDIYVKGLLLTHGYHKGVVLKNFIRKEFAHNSVWKKVNVDASRTLLLLSH